MQGSQMSGGMIVMWKRLNVSEHERAQHAHKVWCLSTNGTNEHPCHSSCCALHTYIFGNIGTRNKFLTTWWRDIIFYFARVRSWACWFYHRPNISEQDWQSEDDRTHANPLFAGIMFSVSFYYKFLIAKLCLHTALNYKRAKCLCPCILTPKLIQIAREIRLLFDGATTHFILFL